MSLLRSCTSLWGTAEIRGLEPDVSVVQDGFYLPYTHGQAWGLFAQDGTPIAAATDYRERTHIPPDQRLETSLTAEDIACEAPHGAYIYGGRINPHFGHFLINTLPRFWAMARIRSPRTPILCHGPGTPAEWFGVPFIAAAFGLLGLSPRDFVNFHEPTRVRSVVIPSTSLEEQSAGYQVYGDMCRKMGARIRATSSVNQNPTPIYYSKTRLMSAVGRITNEHEIETVLDQAGVEIIYPETLSFVDQIRLMSSRERIMGSAGSFLHASIFCPNRRITCLNVTEQINTNYLLIDGLAGNTSTYHYPPALQVLEQQANFLTLRYLPDASDVAREMLELIN